MEQDYLIAGHRIRVEGDGLVQAIETMPGFSVFKAETDGEPMCRFMLSAGELPALKKAIYSSENEGIVSQFGYYEGGFAFLTAPPDTESLKLWIEKEENFAHHLLREIKI